MITLSDEVREILSNARAAHLAGEITDEQFHEVIRSLLRDVRRAIPVETRSHE